MFLFNSAYKDISMTEVNENTQSSVLIYLKRAFSAFWSRVSSVVASFHRFSSWIAAVGLRVFCDGIAVAFGHRVFCDDGIVAGRLVVVVRVRLVVRAVVVER